MTAEQATNVTKMWPLKSAALVCIVFYNMHLAQDSASMHVSVRKVLVCKLHGTFIKFHGL